MSNVIKNSSLSSKPKLIELTDLKELQQSIINIPQYEKKQDELELKEIKAEGEKILRETEQMVLELLERAQSEAQEIILNAQEEADVIRSEIYEEAKKLREQAQKAGYEEGLKLVHEEIEEDRKRALEQNELIIEGARKTKLEMLRSTEPDIVKLIMAITKKVVARELVTNTDSIINVVREAISHLDNPQNVKVYVNPLELEKLLEIMDKETLTDIGSKEITADIKGDNRITIGGCLIESDSGFVDARIETKISNIEQGLQDVSGDE